MAWVCRSCCTNNEDSDERCIICDAIRGEEECILTREDVLALGLTGDVLIPSEYNVIGEGAFSDNNDIKTVTLHSDVKKIMANAFSGCLYLEKVIYSRELKEIGVCAFRDCVSLDSAYRPVASVIASGAFDVSASARQKKKDLDKLLAPPKPPMSEETKKKIGSVIGAIIFFIVFVGFIAALVLVDWSIMQWVVSVIVLGALILVELVLIEVALEDGKYSPSVIVNIVFGVVLFVLMLIFKVDIAVISAVSTAAMTVFTIVIAGIAKSKSYDGYAVGMFLISYIPIGLFNGSIGMLCGWDVLKWVLPVSVLGIVGMFHYAVQEWDESFMPAVFINAALTIAVIICSATLGLTFFPVAVIMNVGLLASSVISAIAACDDIEEGFMAGHIGVAIVNGITLLVVGGNWIF